MSIILTIAIPTYNNEATIERAIQSCLSQSDLDNCEILLIDNHSNDGTQKIYEKFLPSLKVVRNSETVSLFENHNIALRNAQGSFVLFCHSDDELYPHAAKSVKKQISKREFDNSYIFWGHSMFRDFSSAMNNSYFETGKVVSGMYATTPFLLGGLTPSGTCYSRNLIDIGGFLPAKHKIAQSDATSMIHAILNGFRIEMIEDILFRRKEASTNSIEAPRSEVIAGFNDAFNGFLCNLEKKEIRDIILASQQMKILPLKFYLLALDFFPYEVLKRLIENPFRAATLINLIRPDFYKILAKAIFKTICNKFKK